MDIEVIEQTQHENQLQFHLEEQEAFKHIASLRPDVTLCIP